MISSIANAQSPLNGYDDEDMAEFEHDGMFDYNNNKINFHHTENLIKK